MDNLELKGLTPRKFGKTSIIVYQGEVLRDAYLVKEGVVKVYQIGKSGETHIIKFCVKGDIFPVAWIIGSASPAIYYYEAFTDTILETISHDVWNEAVKKPAVKEAYMKYILDKYQSSLVRIAALEQPKARDKILYTLFYLCMQHSREIMPGVWRLDLRLKHQDIAELVGLTRETTAIELHALQEEKVLSYQNQRYLIKREKLLDQLNEESLRSLAN